MRFKHIQMFLFALLVSACSTVGLPELKAPASWSRTSTPNAAVPNPAWWDKLQLSGLSELLAKSLQRSPSVAQAQARLREAKGLQRQAQSALWPRLDLQVGVNEQANDGRGLRRTGGLEAAYALDIFGANRATAAAATANVQAAQADLSLARVNLAAAVVRAYGQLAAQQVIVAASLKIEATTASSQELINARAVAGVASPLEVARVTEQQAATAAQTAQAKQTAAETMALLASLSGLPLKEIQTRAEVLAATPAPTLVQQVSATIVLATPLEVLQQRPDLQRARASLATQLAARDATRALRWPSITLGSVFGLGGWSSTARTVAANAALPLLNFGAIRGSIEAADARASQALIAYEATLNNALTDVETSLAQWNEANILLAQQLAALAAAQRAEAVVAARTQAGLESPLALPAATQATAVATSRLAQAQASYVASYADLFVALAGSTD